MIVDDDLVASSTWLEHHRALAESGFVSFDLLGATATLAQDSIQVVTHVMIADGSDRRISRTVVAVTEPLTSLTSIYPASAWHEREAAELAGLLFLEEPQPGFLLPSGGPPPMAWNAALGERLERPWPGLFEPGDQTNSRRKREKSIPGVRPQWAGTDE